MTRASMIVAAGILTVVTSPVSLIARPQPSPAPPQEAGASSAAGRLTPLKIQLVVTRTLRDKKITSLPYVLWVTANDRQATSLRMGVEVPVRASASPNAVSYNYRPIGTNIDCSATTVEGAYNLNITLSDSSIQFEGADNSGSAGRLADAPAFRSFTSKFSILLRDGQTAQYTSATEPVTGETLKVDVTLNVLK